MLLRQRASLNREGHARLSAHHQTCLCSRTQIARALSCAVRAGAGFSVQALTTGEGALGSLAKFASNFAPELLQEAEEALGVV